MLPEDCQSAVKLLSRAMVYRPDHPDAPGGANDQLRRAAEQAAEKRKQEERERERHRQQMKMLQEMAENQKSAIPIPPSPPRSAGPEEETGGDPLGGYFPAPPTFRESLTQAFEEDDTTASWFIGAAAGAIGGIVAAVYWSQAHPQHGWGPLAAVFALVLGTVTFFCGKVVPKPVFYLTKWTLITVIVGFRILLWLIPLTIVGWMIYHFIKGASR